MKKITLVSLAAYLIILLTIILAMIGCPQYVSWYQTLQREQKLEDAATDRLIMIKDAKARKEAAKNLGLAEIERANGAAAASRKIRESLSGNDVYLRYLWVIGVTEGNSEVVYVPTEANFPIFNRRRRR